LFPSPAGLRAGALLRALDLPIHVAAQLGEAWQRARPELVPLGTLRLPSQIGAVSTIGITPTVTSVWPTVQHTN
jgi:hypothetical protein